MATVKDIDTLVSRAKNNGWSSIFIGDDPPLGLLLLDRDGNALMLTQDGLSEGKAPSELIQWVLEESVWPFPVDIARDRLMEVFDVEDEE